jgi:hypothetical protein
MPEHAYFLNPRNFVFIRRHRNEVEKTALIGASCLQRKGEGERKS